LRVGAWFMWGFPKPANGRATPHHVVWIGLHEPSAELLDQVQAQFNLHPLAIEDAGKAHQRPKLEQYDMRPVSSSSHEPCNS